LKNRFPQEIDKDLLYRLYNQDWVVYAKRCFATPEHVIEYLGRYTHKIAISNHRILNITDNQVTFSYKDYRQSGAKKTMTIDTLEFIARFSLHILPKKFVKIRHYGILSSSGKRKCSMIIKEQLTDSIILEEFSAPCCRPQPAKYNPKVCPCCNKETMRTILHFSGRPPPENWMEIAEEILNLIR
jgi:hypothetical protein